MIRDAGAACRAGASKPVSLPGHKPTQERRGSPASDRAASSRVQSDRVEGGAVLRGLTAAKEERLPVCAMPVQLCRGGAEGFPGSC